MFSQNHITKRVNFTNQRWAWKHGTRRAGQFLFEVKELAIRAAKAKENLATFSANKKTNLNQEKRSWGRSAWRYHENRAHPFQNQHIRNGVETVLVGRPQPPQMHCSFSMCVQHLHYNSKRWVFDIFRLAKLRKKQKWGWIQWSIIVIFFLFKWQFYAMRMGIPHFQTHSNIRFLVTITKASR